MRSLGKQNVLGVLIDALDYDAAVAQIIQAARDQREFSVSALAVHGVMTGVQDPTHRYRLNHLDLVTPDGQPVRWALNLLHGTRLRERVYGPTLMLELCAAASRENLPIYLYGSRSEVVSRLARSLESRFPGIEIAGAEPSVFRRITPEEKSAIAARVRSSGARLLFVGLGCPRQEVFAYEYRNALSIPIIAVGAAFDYHSGFLREPSPWVQRVGLQWLHRLMQDPRRLWKRYVVGNTSYACLVALQALRVTRPDPLRVAPPRSELLWG